MGRHLVAGALVLGLFLVPGLAPAADADKDGIRDSKDRCPFEPEDINSVHDDDGCPDAVQPTPEDGTAADLGREVGQDGAYRPGSVTWLPPMRRVGHGPELDDDSVRDSDDSCPTVPEDEDGFEDGDGCPDPDNDGDGILDVEDRCPLIAEDADGHRDEDGCPEAALPELKRDDVPSADADEDGIPDKLDRCPLEPETVNGTGDTDGCPDGTDAVATLFDKPRDERMNRTGDADRDGVHDLADLCPDEREDIDGFQDRDGCPDVDNDEDGVPDRVDRCPLEAESANDLHDDDGCPDGGHDMDLDLVDDRWDVCPLEPEDRDGLRDEDGCPELGVPADEVVEEPEPEAVVEPAVVNLPPPPRSGDVDGDGLTYYEDDCPFEAEDFDGVLDGDGCPDPDDDNDGVPDTEDECPRAAETVNGYADEDGCPDDLLQSVSGVVRGIQFAAGSSQLLASSYPILKTVSGLLKEHNLLFLTVTGHTDDQGDRETNVSLSQARADEVARYLARRGVDRKQLATVGAGPDKPLETNDTDEGRAANRRVQLDYSRRETP